MIKSFSAAKAAILTILSGLAINPGHTQTWTWSTAPVELQFYTRNQNNVCAIPIEGSLSGGADSIIVNVYINDELSTRQSAAFTGNNFSIRPEVAADTVNYKLGVMSKTGTSESSETTYDRLACGDAFIIYGQSNAVAGYGSAGYTYTNEFIRSYKGSWKIATSSGGEIGVWGLHIARLIKENYGIPVIAINGASGGKSIQILSRDDANPTSTETFYGQQLVWAREAGLDQNIRAFFWHQGESNISNEAENYYDYFVSLREDVYEDYPSVEHIFLYQIRSGCGSATWGWNTIYEAQRKLAEDFDDIAGVACFMDAVNGCHYGENDAIGYVRVAEAMYKPVDKILYGGNYDYPVESANILAAAYTSTAKDQIVLVFDQEVVWTPSVDYDPNEPIHSDWVQSNAPFFLKELFVLDELNNQVESGSADGNKVILELAGTSTFQEISYPPYNNHGQYPEPFLMGINGAGALGWGRFPIADELGVEGCMDETASNYNPDAVIPCLDCCEATGTRGRITRDLVSIMQVRGHVVNISVSGGYTLNVSDIKGATHLQTHGKSSGSYSLQGLSVGVYQVTVLGAGVRQSRLVFVR